MRRALSSLLRGLPPSCGHRRLPAMSSSKSPHTGLVLTSALVSQLLLSSPSSPFHSHHIILKLKKQLLRHLRTLLGTGRQHQPRVAELSQSAAPD